MKHKTLLFITFIFFLLLNTTYYWEPMLGGWAMLSTVILLLAFIFLAIALCYQIFLAIRKGGDKSRLILISILILVLSTTALRPGGIINFEKLEDKDLLIAGREGVANCFTILKLKENGTFYIRESCFGVDKNTGTYNINKDTVRFKFDSNLRNNKSFAFGIIKLDHNHKGKTLGQIDFYKALNDSIAANTLYITKNDLTK